MGEKDCCRRRLLNRTLDRGKERKGRERNDEERNGRAKDLTPPPPSLLDSFNIMRHDGDGDETCSTF